MSTNTDPKHSTATELLREARRKRGMSQRELARAAEVPQSTIANIESGRQQPSVAMLERLLAAAGFRLETALANSIRPSQLLEEHRDRVAALLKRHHVSRAWVFGSVAQGTDRPDSDLDILVELSSDASFDDHLGLQEDLASELGCPVDVITTKELRSNDLFRRRVKRNRRQLEIAA